MPNDSLLASLVAKVGDAAILWRRLQGPVPAQAVGTASDDVPDLVQPVPGGPQTPEI